MDFEPLPQELEDLGREVVDAAFEVHRVKGPGLYESLYEGCLIQELHLRGIHAEQQVPLPTDYKGIHIDVGYRLDIVVEKKIILELKTVEKLIPLHHAQLLTYLKTAKCRLGYLLNFNTELMKDGIKRKIAGPFEDGPNKL